MTITKTNPSDVDRLLRLSDRVAIVSDIRTGVDVVGETAEGEWSIRDRVTSRRVVGYRGG